MTLHVYYDHQCPSCGAYYVPYDHDVPCPRCGSVEKERFDYVPQAVASLRYNLEAYGSYVPPAWWVGSLGDHILNILFYVFETYRRETEKRAFGNVAKEMLDQMDWGDQEYLRNHIYAIAIRIYKELDTA